MVKVAYSGGVDSHVLLHALCALRAEHAWTLGAIHVDHGLHPDSAKWSAHCLHVCRELGVACVVERVERPRGGEGGARRARYARLARHIGPEQVLLTAHHLDDQAETVLLQLLRGAGVRGLAAMPESMAFAGGRLLRPLLGVRRAQLLQYARLHGLRWVEDTSNLELAYARNMVRHQLMPLLRQRWPHASESLARAGAHAAEAAALLDALAAQDLEPAAVGAAHTLSIPVLRRLSPARRRNALRYWIRRCGFMAPPAPLTEAVVHMIDASTRSGQALLRWPGTELRRHRDRLSIMAPLAEPDPALCLAWDPQERLIVPGTGYALRTEPAIGQGLSCARLVGMRLTVRLRRGGERCQLPGRAHRHSLKKLLQASDVPPWARLRLPLVYAGEELAAIADRWVCAPFAAGAGETGLRIVLESANSGNTRTPVV